MNRKEIEKSIHDMFSKTNLVINEVSIKDDEDTGMVWFSIRTNEPELFIGRGGETLQAWNHIVRKMVEKQLMGAEAFTEIMIDVNDYQKKKVDNLKTIAHMMAERARFFKSSVDVDPMSAYERKIIHAFLSTKGDVKTESIGEGKNRHIVIKYVGL
jgi:spoIIIJ-associated protein